MPALVNIKELNIGLYLFAISVALVLLAGVAADRSRSRPFVKCYMGQLAAYILVLLGEMGLLLFEDRPELVPLQKVCCVLAFGCGYLVVAFYGYSLVSLIREKEPVSWKYAHLLACVCALFGLFSLTSLWTGTLYYFDAAGCLHYTRLYRSVPGFDTAALVFGIGLVAFYYKKLGRRGTITMLSLCVFMLLAVPLQNVWGIAPMYMCELLGMLTMYLMYHSELSHRLVEKEHQLTESRIRAAISQIQPHFLYNVLNSIYYLCGEDPAAAQRMIEKFSDYLRSDLDSFGQAGLIPFRTELHHIQTYLELEKLRFGDELTVVYDIQTDNFSVPVLSVQPLVENAVKHGVTKKRGGGVVTLATREETGCYVVTVADTGVGFDPAQPAADDGVHVGIANVRLRVEQLAGGLLGIASAPGAGTTAVLTLPKKHAQDALRPVCEKEEHG